jgi:hypothetical protein
MSNLHDDDHNDLADAITDVIWEWLTLVVTKVRSIVRKARGRE